MSNFYQNYYSHLEGATILKFNGMVEDVFGCGDFPSFKVKFSDGSVNDIEISRDEEGNGGGFIFGLALPS